MKSIFRFTMWSVLGLLAAVAVLATLWMALGMPHDSVVLSIDDQGITLPGGGAADWVEAGLGLTVAFVVVLLVVPFTLLVGLGVPALVMAAVGAALAVALGAALAAALLPLALPVLLVVWLVRRDRRAMQAAMTRCPAPAPSTTIAG
jgi:hypothetical protein